MLFQQIGESRVKYEYVLPVWQHFLVLSNRLIIVQYCIKKQMNGKEE